MPGRCILLVLVLLLLASGTALAASHTAPDNVEGKTVIEDPPDDASLLPVSVRYGVDPSVEVGPFEVAPGEAEVPNGPLPEHLDLREVRLAGDGQELAVQIQTDQLDEDVRRSAYSLAFWMPQTGPDRVHELKCYLGDHLGIVEGSMECWFSFATSQPNPYCRPQPCYEEETHSVEKAVLVSEFDMVSLSLPYTWFEGETGSELRGLEAETWRCTSASTERFQPVLDGVPDTECGVVDEGTAASPSTLS